MRDFCLAFLLLILCLPLMLAIVLISFLFFGGELFYCSERLGLNQRKFTIFKFRTMRSWSPERLECYLNNHPGAEEQWNRLRKLNPDPRCSRWGTFLRRFSLDELPQFFNVLAGDMALVGPRPIVEDEKRFYGKYCSVLHSVKPGLTGLWQVSGRNELSYHRRVAINIFYIRNRSWKLDLIIMVRTVWAVIGGRGAF